MSIDKSKENLDKFAASVGLGGANASTSYSTPADRPGGWLNNLLKKININVNGTAVVGEPPKNNNNNFMVVGFVLLLILLLSNNKR